MNELNTPFIIPLWLVLETHASAKCHELYVNHLRFSYNVLLFGQFSKKTAKMRFHLFLDWGFSVNGCKDSKRQTTVNDILIEIMLHFLRSYCASH